MRVSFSSGTFYHRALHYSLELARDAGYDGVEAVLGPGYLARGVEPWRQAIQRTGVPAFSVHPPFFPLPGWPRRFTQTIPREATVARELDAALAVVHTPFFTDEHSPLAEHYTAGPPLSPQDRALMLDVLPWAAQKYHEWLREDQDAADAR